MDECSIQQLLRYSTTSSTDLHDLNMVVIICDIRMRLFPYHQIFLVMRVNSRLAYIYYTPITLLVAGFSQILE